MISLNQLLKRQPNNVPKKIAILLFVVALLGFADAAYLTIEHYRGVIPPCTVVSGCELVLTSDYSVVAGIPVSLGGTIFYLIILIGIFAYLDFKKPRILQLTLFATVPGFIASLWFLYLQVFVIHSYCLYCLGSALTSTLLFIISMWVFSKYSVTDTLT